MRDFRLKSLEIFNSKPMPLVGRADRHQFPGRVLLSQAHRQPEPLLGRRAGGDQEHVRQAGDSRGREEVPLRREGPVRERGRLRLAPRGPGQAGRDLHRHRFGRARPSGPAPRVFQHDHPAHRQQVRRAEFGRLVGRVVHLRAQGPEDRLPLAGLFPHQRGQHGPVRADADHRRRGRPGALRGRLHGPHVQHRKPALGRGRSDRQARLPRPLYDDPELGQQHLQPGDQAGHGLRRFARGVGRRQPRQPLDDEVPGHLHDRAGRPRRSALRGLRLRTASTRTPGPRSSTAPRTPPAASSRSRSPRTAAGPAIAACARSCREPRSRSPTSSATP